MQKVESCIGPEVSGARQSDAIDLKRKSPLKCFAKSLLDSGEVALAPRLYRMQSCLAGISQRKLSGCLTFNVGTLAIIYTPRWR